MEFNKHFNTLWEGSLQGSQPSIQHKLAAFEKQLEKIHPGSSSKECEEYITAKYLNRMFFSHESEPLFLQPSNPLHPWQPRYFQVSDQGQIGIYQDNQFKQVLESFNMSWCAFQSGKELNLSPEYIQFINPMRVDLYRAKNEASAAKWLILLQVGLTRAKCLQFASSLPSQAGIAESFQFGLTEVSTLFGEKTRLATLLARKKEHLELKASLEAQLQATLAEIVLLTEREALSINKISQLEPPQIKRHLTNWATLMDENEQHIEGSVNPSNSARTLRLLEM